MDIDSFVCDIKTKDFYKDIAKDLRLGLIPLSIVTIDLYQLVKIKR